MGAPVGNKNAAGPHGGGSHPHDRPTSSHRDATASDHRRLAPVKVGDQVQIDPELVMGPNTGVVTKSMNSGQLEVRIHGGSRYNVHERDVKKF